ncbi:hypothetical protein [Paenibacillus senegalensis]|uniref:hypothetical protein n=1 Tax=Paenibacillus senegalensis TaxID=1465766 RepID=UPI000287DC41|nr:hypothetical protein [Paenibacillus senegalensis]
MELFYTVLVALIIIFIVLFGIYMIESKRSRIHKNLLKKGAKAQATVEAIEQIGGNDTHAFVQMKMKVNQGMEPVKALMLEIGIPREDLARFESGKQLELHYNKGYKIVVGGHLGEILSREADN